MSRIKRTNETQVDFVAQIPPLQRFIQRLPRHVQQTRSRTQTNKHTHTRRPRSAVVSASDCGSEGLGFESHQSHVGFFNPGRLLARAGSAMGPVGRLEPHSRASSTSRMRLRGCCSNDLTNTAGAAVSRVWLTPG